MVEKKRPVMGLFFSLESIVGSREREQKNNRTMNNEGKREEENCRTLEQGRKNDEVL
jgi:hypothetical protein